MAIRGAADEPAWSDGKLVDELAKPLRAFIVQSDVRGGIVDYEHRDSSSLSCGTCGTCERSEKRPEDEEPSWS
jgi:hypothetical protein